MRAADGDTVVTGDLNGRLHVYVWNGKSWTLQARLRASNWEDRDFFGRSVAISGDVIVVGAPVESSSARGIDGDGDDNGSYRSGAAYIFQRSGTTWSQAAYLKASNSDAMDFFGASVAVDGDIVVVGAPDEDSISKQVDGNSGDNSGWGAGAAYVFRRSGGNWTQDAYLKAHNTGNRGNPLFGGSGGDGFGSSVAVSGNHIAVGAPHESGASTGINGNANDQTAQWTGAVYTYNYTSSWQFESYIKAHKRSRYFGSSLGFSSKTLVVGAPSDSGVGEAFVFSRRMDNNWEQSKSLRGAVATFGEEVAIYGDIIVVGEPGYYVLEDPGAYVYERLGDDWIRRAYLKKHFPEGEFSLAGVAVSKDRVFMGAYAFKGYDRLPSVRSARKVAFKRTPLRASRKRAVALSNQSSAFVLNFRARLVGRDARAFRIITPKALFPNGKAKAFVFFRPRTLGRKSVSIRFKGTCLPARTIVSGSGKK